ncbi:exonuclease [Brevundimonas phage vB_BpoS-Papperlapapp]|uniref:Helix-turn-helix protein n=2 Tax=Marchewkavirus TaxID=3425052 RepID=A0A9E7MQ83_9CAUD|nr:helix-turn-helix protein [Brevundimonas phage vB_BpoS-Kabachok]USN14769.1 helix-turn-helix protein [Brevundimonas phage vB_BpoS-Domovoi]USN16141.1 exonuclease [Brevundimonas phage vB_BpoS-Papperlapapp]
MTDNPQKPKKVSTGRKNGERYITAEVDRRIATRLLTRRTEIGLTQKALALKMNLTPQQIAKYESGENRLMAGTIHLLAETLQVSPNYFYKDPSSNFPATDPALMDEHSALLAQGGVKLLADFTALSPGRRKVVAALVTSLTELKEPKS